MVWGWGTNDTVLIAVDSLLENPARSIIIIIIIMIMIIIMIIIIIIIVMIMIMIIIINFI